MPSTALLVLCFTLMAVGIIIEVQQHRLDFPAGNILFVPGYYLLLLTIQPAATVAIRICHISFTLVASLLQLGHAKYWREIPPMCDRTVFIVCFANTGHVVIAHVYGVFFLFLLALGCNPPSGDEALRRLWWVSRLVVTCLCINLAWPPIVTLFSTLGQGLFAPDATFGFQTDFGPVYGPPIHDATIFVTVSFWFCLVLLTGPHRRAGLRDCFGLPPVEAAKSSQILL